MRQPFVARRARLDQAAEMEAYMTKDAPEWLEEQVQAMKMACQGPQHLHDRCEMTCPSRCQSW